MKQIKINGIRLNKNYLLVDQKHFNRQDQDRVPIYKALASNRINMAFVSMNTMGKDPFISGTIASKYFGRLSGRDNRRVAAVSIYPHHYSLQLLGFLLEILGKEKMPFLHMVPSNAMLTFVIDQQDCDAFICLLSTNFDLPESHVPFEQEENDELSLFLKKKYPESRATYVEDKIKTYGIALKTGLNFYSYLFSFDGLVEYGQKIVSMKDKFFHTSAHISNSGQIDFFLMTEKTLNIPSCHTGIIELLNFHGPHFGDRHSIISRALNCLYENKISVLQTHCTGASISIVLPRGKGAEAKHVLMDVFQVP